MKPHAQMISWVGPRTEREREKERRKEGETEREEGQKCKGKMRYKKERWDKVGTGGK